MFVDFITNKLEQPERPQSHHSEQGNTGLKITPICTKFPPSSSEKQLIFSLLRYDESINLLNILCERYAHIQPKPSFS